MSPHWVKLLWDTPFVFKAAAVGGAYAWLKQRWDVRKQARLNEESRTWPAARARVVAVQAHPVEKEKRNQKWYGLLTYSYIVDEVEIGEHREWFASEDEADEWVRLLRGRVLNVLVKPGDPKVSVWPQAEAEEVRRSVVRTVVDQEPAVLPPWMEVVRLLGLVVSLVGAAVSAALEAARILTYLGYPTPVYEARYLLFIAIGCSMVAARIFSKRYPGRSLAALASNFRDPAVKLLLRVLGVLEGSALVSFWLHAGDFGDLRLAYVGPVAAAIWSGLFATAATTFWLCGERNPRAEHELAPPR